MKGVAEEALLDCPTIEKVIIVERTGTPHNSNADRDLLWNNLMADAKPDYRPEQMDVEDPLFILYSSGTTGKPKGILHTTGGYLVGVNATYRYVFDYREDDLFWCTADIGWITGHSYIVYGPLSNGATIFVYEGTPDFPTRDRFFELIEKYKFSVFYTAPTAIRSFMRWGNHIPAKHDLSSLRLLGSVGEPINPEAWPAMLLTLYEDDDRYKATYWKQYPGLYFTGDGALVDHHSVAEAAVIGKTHEIKGHAITAFVTLKEGVEGNEDLVKELKSHVGKIIGLQSGFRKL